MKINPLKDAGPKGNMSIFGGRPGRARRASMTRTKIRTRREAVGHPARGQRPAEAAGGFGPRLRHARLVKGLTLKEVANSAGCSESLVSKLDHGKASPSISMLHRIVAALGINIAALFDGEGPADDVVFRAGAHPILGVQHRRARGQVRLERLIPHAPNRLLQCNIHIVPAGAGTDGYFTHEGEETGYVLEGEIELTVGERTRRLKAGDSFVFRSELFHSYRNPGKALARVLWVNTPPTF